jgi:hypothetical protein
LKSVALNLARSGAELTSNLLKERVRTVATTAAFCKMCRGTGKIRRSQGFFTLEDPCPACRPAEASRAQETRARSGYVYLLQLAAGIIKMGHTHRHPEDRANEWGLTLLAYARSEDSADAEQRIHKYLSRYRKGSYELFEMSISEALRALEQVVGKPTIWR